MTEAEWYLWAEIQAGAADWPKPAPAPAPAQPEQEEPVEFFGV
jgi:hypothetical protein